MVIGKYKTGRDRGPKIKRPKVKGATGKDKGPKMKRRKK